MMSNLLFNPRLRSVIKCVKFAKASIFGGLLQGKFADKAATEKIFNQYIADVNAYVPADKLLVYNGSEGWEPLYKFLGVPIPNQPVPHLNKKENFKEMLVEWMNGNMV